MVYGEASLPSSLTAHATPNPYTLAPHEKIVNLFKQRGEGAILMLFRHRPSQKVFLVTNSHLYWNPQYPDIKVLQAWTLAREIGEYEQYNNIVCA